MTINELIEKAHAAAKSKGFWDQERNTGELLMLIVSECGEALEAHRSGKRADLRRFLERQESYLESWTMAPPERIEQFSSPSVADVGYFNEHIKDTFEDELAGIVIRIADLMGAWNMEYEGAETKSPKRINHSVGRQLLSLVETIVPAWDIASGSPDRYRLCFAIDQTFIIANTHNIDLWRHIELKLAYNATRHRLHGKAY